MQPAVFDHLRELVRRQYRFLQLWDQREIIATVKENLNLREGAGPSYAIIKTMQQGDTVTVIDNSHPTWARVRTADGTVGCCSKEFLDIQANSASGAPSDRRMRRWIVHGK